MKGRKLRFVLLPAAAVLLELLPYGAVLNFGVQAEDAASIRFGGPTPISA